MDEYKERLVLWGFPQDYKRVREITCPDSSYFTIDVTPQPDHDGTRRQIVQYYDSDKKLFATYFIPNFGSQIPVQLRYLRTDTMMTPVDRPTMLLGFIKNRSMIAQGILDKILGKSANYCGVAQRS